MQRRDERILVVDDHPATVTMLTDALRADGYRPVVTGDPRQALALLAKDRFDLVIADVVMPYFDGLALLEQAKARHPGTEVLLISAFASAKLVREARDKGAAAFLRKPFDLGSFMTTVHEILARGKPSEETAGDAPTAQL